MCSEEYATIRTVHDSRIITKISKNRDSGKTHRIHKMLCAMLAVTTFQISAGSCSTKKKYFWTGHRATDQKESNLKKTEPKKEIERRRKTSMADWEEKESEPEIGILRCLKTAGKKTFVETGKYQSDEETILW